MRRKDKHQAEDPAKKFQRYAQWSSFTGSWNRRFGGWHWPPPARQLFVVLLVGAGVGATFWAVSQLAP